MTDISDTVERSLGRRLWKGYCRYAMMPKLMIFGAMPAYAQAAEAEDGSGTAGPAALIIIAAAAAGAYARSRRNDE